MSALCVRASAVPKVSVAKRSTRPAQVHAVKLAAAGVASLAVAAAVVAPVEAAQLMSTVASATEGYPFVPPVWAPSVLVPLTGLVIPAVVMGSLFVYIEKEAPTKQ